MVWEAFRDSSGKVYYGNRETSESSWNPPPRNEKFIPFPQEDILKHWEAYRSTIHNNELFFLNSLTGEKTWERPFNFKGMPLGEEEDHEKGPFVEYIDDSKQSYYYNPRTKLVTREKPQINLISETEAFSELEKQGLLWRGVSSKINEKKQDTHQDDASSSDSSSFGDEEEEGFEAQKNDFFNMLKEKGVNHVSRWPNWLPKLLNEPAYQKAPKEKTREWFETFVRDRISSNSGGKAALIKKAKELLKNWNGDFSNLEQSLLRKELPAELMKVLQELTLTDRNLLVASLSRKT